MSTRRPRISGDTSQQQGPKKQQGRRGAECLGNQRGYKGILAIISILRDMEDQSILKHIVILFDLRFRLTQNWYFYDLKHSQVRFADIDFDYFRAHHEFCHLIE